MRDFLQQIKKIFFSLSKTKRIIFLSLIGTTFLCSFLAFLWINKPNFKILYSNLDPEDAKAILVKLKEQKIPYKISGNTILVPEEKVYELRLSMAGKGIVKGFELFDNIKIGQTEFAQKINYERALQGELTRTIAYLPQVENVRVHIVRPEESLFVEDQKEATASIMLKIKPGMTLKPQEVRGIAYLVAGAVEGLEPENITILDNSGKILYLKNTEDDIGQLTNSQLEYQRNVEKNLEKKIETMLNRIVGEGKAMARVRADIDFKQIDRVEENYDPYSAVPRSKVVTKENFKGETPVPLGKPEIKYEAEKVKTNRYNPRVISRNSETVNYEINKVTNRIIDSVGEIKKLSVAVVVDEKQIKGAEEIEKIKNLVKAAVGFNEDRGDQVEVTSMNFAFPEWEKLPSMKGEGLKGYIKKVYKPLVATIFLFLLFLFFIRPLVKWLTATPLSLEKPKEILVEKAIELEKIKETETEEDIYQLVKKKPDKSLEIIKEWLKESG